MKKMLFLFAMLMTFSQLTIAQTLEELKAQKAEKKAQVDALNSEIATIQGDIDALPGWTKGALGLVGINFANYDDWLGRDNPSTESSSIGLTANAFANLKQEKYFWRNAGNLNLQWTKVRDKTVPEQDDNGLELTADNINITSLFGYSLTEKLAASTLAEYRSTIGSFNDPGYLDIGVGGTWTPIADLVVVFHPLNYNFVFAEDDVAYTSSLGAKIVADYARSLPMGISWRSNLSIFASYEDLDNLSNWTWVNSFAFNVWKGIGVGFEVGLRKSKQEALGVARKTNETITFDNLDDNPLQSYWLLGITYSL